MPRRLQRKEYGWSYTYGREQRTLTPEFKANYERIKWNKDNPDDWQDSKCHFGRSKVKRFPNEKLSLVDL